MEYYPIIRKKGILSYASELLCLEDITLSEINQLKKDTYSMISHRRGIQRSQIYRDRK